LFIISSGNSPGVESLRESLFVKCPIVKFSFAFVDQSALTSHGNRRRRKTEEQMTAIRIWCFMIISFQKIGKCLMQNFFDICRIVLQQSVPGFAESLAREGIAVKTRLS